MRIQIFPDAAALARAAAAEAAHHIRTAIAALGRARIVAATGASQIAFLEALVATPGIDWKRVEAFHLDEYIGLGPDHPASFRRYLRERLIRPAGIARFHPIDGQDDPAQVCASLGAAIRERPIDVAFVGIGENGHLAFNDPPADFETDHPYIFVQLDEACRRQQVGEGWFSSIAEVPARAITMSIAQILRSNVIVAVVPEARKATAVRLCLEGNVSSSAPASVLQRHPHASVFLDRDSSALLSAGLKACTPCSANP
jgi:glucosamine-6-phosphate deaminase